MSLKQSAVSLCLLATVFAEPSWAQLGMTNPVDPDPPNEPCAEGNQITQPAQLPQTYKWAPGDFLDATSLTKPDEQDGRLHGFLRFWAVRAASPNASKGALVEAVRLYLRLTNPDEEARALALTTKFGTISWVGPNVDPRDLAIPVAQLAVTGRQAFGNFKSWHPLDADLIQEVQQEFPTINTMIKPPDNLNAAVKSVLDTAYSALWAIRSNDPVWRAQRAQMSAQNGWIAVSGEDDTPHRPVNVPTAPYPQYDLSVTANGPLGPVTVVTRYTVASPWTYLGPDAPPPGWSTPKSGPAPSAPRTLPIEDLPVIPPGNKIIVYVHGGGSRLEEADALTPWLITWGEAATAEFGAPFNQDYTVISFDLPNSGYGESFPLENIIGSGTYHPSSANVLMFEEQYIINFIEALDQKVHNVKNRIAAVMGGSLGGNTSLLLARESKDTYPYLRTIVAWSPTSMMPSQGALGNGIVGLSNLNATTFNPEGPANRGLYFHALYFEPLGKIWGINIGNLPSDPTMWAWDGWVNPDGFQCKTSLITQSRFDRYEVYSGNLRRWTTAIDTEQAIYSFQDSDAGSSLPRYGQITSRLLLVAGQKDCFTNACTGSSDQLTARTAATIDIYGYTHDTANSMRAAPGRTLFINNTGHSIHSERPRFFAREIVHFLNIPDTNLRVDLTTGSTGLRFNSLIDTRFMFPVNGTSGESQPYLLNAIWHPYVINCPIVQCFPVYGLGLAPNSQTTFIVGLSRESFPLGDIQRVVLGFNGHGKFRPTDTGDNWDVLNWGVTAISSPVGTGEMFDATGQPLWRGTSPSDTDFVYLNADKIMQPSTPLPKLSANVTYLSNAVVIQATDADGKSVLGTVAINSTTGSTVITGNTSQQISPPVACLDQACPGLVYAPGFADGSFAIGPLNTLYKLAPDGSLSNPNIKPSDHGATYIPLSAAVCPTADGKSCTSGSTFMHIVTATSNGAPVQGATVVATMSGKQTSVVTDANGVAIVSYDLCFSRGSQVLHVGELKGPVRTPIPCQWPATVSKPFYQPFSFRLP